MFRLYGCERRVGAEEDQIRTRIMIRIRVKGKGGPGATYALEPEGCHLEERGGVRVNKIVAATK